MTARVRQIKRRRGTTLVELASLDHPLFDKKPLSAFSVGQTLTGKVLGILKNVVLVDVGAMGPGAVPLSEAGGAKEGESIEVKVAEVTNARLYFTIA